MKALDPPSDRFDKRLKNTRYELHISNKDAKTNHILQIPIVKAASLDSQSLSSAIGNNQQGSLELVSAPTNEDTKHNLYSYGPSTFDTEILLAPAKSKRDLVQLMEPAKDGNISPGKGSKKKENPLRPPVVDRGTLCLPAQKPPPPQPVGPVSASLAPPLGSQIFANKSTASLLGLDPSLSSSIGSMPLSQPSSLEHIIKVPSAVALRPKLASIDLLSEVGDEIDNETRARTASYEIYLDRQQSMASSASPLGRQQSRSAVLSCVPLSTAPNTVSEGGYSPRPVSPSIQLFDFNKMARMDVPPSPSVLDRQQQELSIQMKFAYLNAPAATAEDPSSTKASSVKSRPQSRSKTPSGKSATVAMTTQVLRLPFALSHELSIYTEGSETFNPHSSTDSFLKVPNLNEGSGSEFRVNLNMGSEIEASVVTNLRSSSEDALNTGLSSPMQLDPIGLDGAAPLYDAANAEPAPAFVAVALKMQQLSPEQLQQLRQPHYQDPQFQSNPREIVYKLRGHLLNTTPFPEEVAHLSLHTKGARLPQYLRVQQEEQQARYAAKLRQMSHTQRRADSQSPDARSPKHGAQYNKSTQEAASTRPGEIDIAAREIDFSEFVKLETPTGTPKNATSSLMKSNSEPVFPNKDRALSMVAESIGASEQLPSPKATTQATAKSESMDSFNNIRHVMSDELVTARAEGEGEDDAGSLAEGSLGDGSQTSILSQAHSRTSSPSDRKRSVSLRITSTGSMVEEIIGPAGETQQRPQSPQESIGSIQSAISGGSNRIGAGFAKAASNVGRASSPMGVTSEGASASAKSAPPLAVRGKSPTQRNKGKSTSPNRVAYVLNKNSPTQVGSADAADDRSLHSIHSLHSAATGNYSAITDDANASALSYNLALVPPAAQSPEYPHRTMGTGTNKGTTRFVPRLDGMFGDSTSQASESAESVMPYQVHRKVMGWKLTSVQRRRNLVGMLDLVANSRKNRKGVSSPPRTALEFKVAPPLQVPHSLLRTGHGKRVRSREVPPLGAVQKQLLSIQNQQQELQKTQVMHGFHYAGDSPLPSPTMKFNDSIDTGSLTKSISRHSSKKKIGGRNALSASTSNLAALAMQVEDMARYLPSDSRPTSPPDNY